MPGNMQYSVNPGFGHNLSARPGISTYSMEYTTHRQSSNHQSRLRDMAPAHHINQQPQFRTGPVHRNEHFESQAGPRLYQPAQPVFQAAYTSSATAPLSHGHLFHPPPPPPPPPPGGFSGPYRPPVQRNYGASQQVFQRAAKKPRSEFFCETCTKGFDCEEDFDIHIAEDHVTCPHVGCGFSGREDVVRAHKVKHTVNTDSKEEVDAWVAMRRYKFPRKTGASPSVEEPKVVSKLERSIRSSIRQAKIDARKQRLAKDQKQPCIHWERTGKCKFGDTCSFGHEKQGVCTFFVNHGRCRHGDSCKYKHVKRNSYELDELRNPHGGLLKKLLSVETSRWEGKILQVLRHAVNNNFYQKVEGGEEGPVPGQNEEEEDEVGDSADEVSLFSDEQYDDVGEEPFSPISNIS